MSDVADSPRLMAQHYAMEGFCKVCDNIENHREECPWCEYVEGMNQPSRFQPTLKIDKDKMSELLNYVSGVEYSEIIRLTQENFKLRQENAELKRGITKLYQSLGD